MIKDLIIALLPALAGRSPEAKAGATRLGDPYRSEKLASREQKIASLAFLADYEL
jgi:hypothetical protein